jgi:hypothetical protein
MRKAEPIAGLGGILLLVALFLPWYWPDVEGQSVAADSISGWQAMTVIDILLALLALLALAVPVVSLVTRGPAASVGTAVLASALGWLAVVLVAIKILFGPGDSDLGVGIWLALAGSMLGWVGSWLSLRDESTPGAVAPEVPRRPAPPNIPA